MNRIVDKQKEEWIQVKHLFQKLGISVDIVQKSERPDFKFSFQSKVVGLEHTRCVPSCKDGNKGNLQFANDLRRIENEICECLKDEGIFAQYSLKNYKQVESLRNFQEQLLADLKWAFGEIRNKNINRVDELSCLERCKYLNYLSVFRCHIDGLRLLNCNVEFANSITSEHINECINRKENKIEEYKAINEDIEEYWLLLFVPFAEHYYVDNSDFDLMPSSYSKIFLIEDKFEPQFLIGDYSSIRELK